MIDMQIEELYKKYCNCRFRVTTDTRKIRGGEMFFALKGENFDGNDFVETALRNGAYWAVTDRESIPEGRGIIKVENSLKALQDLASYHRGQMGDGRLPVIALTGTNGKTTTKNLIKEVLSCRYKVTATEGNLNNDIGVPLSLLRITPRTQIAVIEMGASHPDDIAKLVRICKPDYGLITNIGKGHLLGFGSYKGVKQAKGELYKWLGEHRYSLIFLNEDDEVLRRMASSQPCHIFGYGLEYQSAEILPTTPEEPFLRIKLDGQIISTNLMGAYNADNVLAAIAVGDRFGVTRKEAIAAIERYIPDNSRSQMVRTERNTLIVDAYNANPSSMAAALDSFAAIQSERKAVMLGDMKELGDESLSEHCKVLERLRKEMPEAYFVGEEFKKALGKDGREPGWKWFEDSAALAAYLKENPVNEATVLIKGSHSTEMEKVVPEL